MLGLMWAFSGQETIPYHLLFVSLTLVYGFRVWPPRATWVVISVVTLATGTIFWRHIASGIVNPEEMAEVVLMPMLFLAMVWHARRRAEAVEILARMAEERRDSLEREREFLRDTSHAIRTPVTIARGHLELLEPDLPNPVAREDVSVVLHQLERMSTLGARLLALARLEDGLQTKAVDLSGVLGHLTQNWAASSTRRWVIELAPGVMTRADASWLEDSVDAIVENAIRFTDPCDTIRVSLRVNHGLAVVEVADSGPGIADEDLPHVFDRYWHRTPPDGLTGSGLGLSMVKAVAQSHGGRVSAGRAPEGGALFSMHLPRLPSQTPVPAEL
jgi:signal transduction histidine kinase